MTDDTDRQKRDEALATLVGWEYKPICKDGPSFWQRIGSVNQIICPDMATPEGADELVEFCRKRGVFISTLPTTKDYFWHAYAGGKEHYAGASAELTFTRPDAVCQAVYALYKGGYLTEKEPTE